MAASRAPAAALLAVALLLAGCGSRWERSLRLAESLAAQGGLERVAFDTGGYVLTGFHTQSRGGDLVVYIQGDGRAYLDRNTVSPNPTPDVPVALLLALADPAPNVLYLGRPCQFTGPSEPDAWRGCHETDWTVGRYSPRLVAAMGTALDEARVRFHADTLHLVGHSGGGAMAVLLAAGRDDVASLMTVAGNLDHAAWSRHHGVTPLAGSANPADAAPALRRHPQIHFRGGRDRIVPPATTAGFFRALDDASCSRVVDIEDMGHGREWAARWPKLLRLRNDMPCFQPPSDEASFLGTCLFSSPSLSMTRRFPHRIHGLFHE